MVMMLGLVLGVASAATVEATDMPVWLLDGEVPCDASVVLDHALDDGVLEVHEAQRVGACDHTSPLLLETMDTFLATRAAIEAMADDPEGLVVLAKAVSTYRSGLLGDGVRLALQSEIAMALEGAEPGPWQATLAEIAVRESGPMPGEDLPVFEAMLRERMWWSSDLTWWERGRGSVEAGLYLAALPFVKPWVEATQQAVESEDPHAALARVAAAWDASWVPTMGVVPVTQDLLESEGELRDRWDGLLADM